MTSKNILFIMCDQLRFDYLGCYGHPHIRTPHIDALSKRGVRFDRAYVQSPVCGPSRISFYTGRYVRSHGATWNTVPLRVGEVTIGDHLNPLGMRTVLCGKSHVVADVAGMARLGIDPHSAAGQRIGQGGFEVWDRHDGVHPARGKKKPSHYNQYLNANGYPGSDPWEHWANAVQGDDGEALSGWSMRHLDKPARVKAEHSETAYMTDRAIEFMTSAGPTPWCLHLSYIKPHWPYVVPAPYHAMYGPDDVLPVNRHAQELDNTHPVLAAFQAQRFSREFSRPDVRERVIPAYMGLITQIDDHIGRLMAWLDASGHAENTLIVFTADHGDYLGDHWLGEKDLFHEASVKVPLIVVDPSRQADVSRGTVCHALVQAIDVLPTFVEVAGGVVPPHILEGQSLLPFLHQTSAPTQRPYVVSEYDYAYREARHLLGQTVRDARLQMIFDGTHKLINAPGYRPMLYDLQADPHELQDLGDLPGSQPAIARLLQHLTDWSLCHHAQITHSEAQVNAIAGSEEAAGIYIGYWDARADG